MKPGCVYLDYNAGAPLRAPVLESLRAWSPDPANPSSVHAFGRQARSKIEAARGDVAALANVDPAQVIFNSGATEGNNSVLAAFAGQRILTSAIEHPSVSEAAPQAERIPVTPDGLIDLNALDRLIKTGAPPALICAMLVNNETGVIQPIADISALARRCGAALHVDGAQAAGRIPLDMAHLGADFLTLSAHKIGGLSGSGALVLGSCRPPPVLLHGGGQENRARAGTENLCGIMAFGLAARAAQKGLDSYAQIARLRDHLESRVEAVAPAARFFGRAAPRVANTSLFALPGLNAQTALIHMDMEGIAISSGAACASGVVKPSPTLLAMGETQAMASCALRVSMGWDTTEPDIARFISAFETMANRLKARGAQAT